MIKYKKIYLYSLIVNLLFWLGLAIWGNFIYQSNSEYFQVYRYLVFAPLIVFGILIYGIRNSVVWLNYLALPYLLIHTFLSVADEAGVHDIIAGLLGLISLALLIIYLADNRK